MTFELVRAGLPNTAAILALAIMPIVMVTLGNERHPAAVQQLEAAAYHLIPAERAVIATFALPETIAE
jgi:hypothetical protein